MNEAITLRTARAEDAGAVFDLEAHFTSDRMSLRSVRGFLRSPAARVVIAERAGRVLGNLILLLPKRWRAARIYSVVVAPEARGLGVGAKLVGAAEAIARGLNREAIVLEVRRDNAAARALYAKHGYIEERPLPEFYEDGADGLRLRKRFRFDRSD